MSEFIDIQDLGLDDEGLRPAEGGMREPPQKGEYVLEVTGCEPSVSQNNNRTLVITSTVVSMADGSPTDEAGKDFKQWFSLGSHEYSRRRLKNMLNALGVSLAGFSPEDVVGTQYKAEIFHEFYDKENTDGEVRTFINARTRKERSASAE